jgi:hypothetical protein
MELNNGINTSNCKDLCHYIHSFNITTVTYHRKYIYMYNKIMYACGWTCESVGACVCVCVWERERERERERDTDWQKSNILIIQMYKLVCWSRWTCGLRRRS